MNKPAWLLALPACTVLWGGEEVSARYIPQSPDERRRGVTATWLDENHPYTNPRNPGRIGSAFMMPERCFVTK